MTTPRSRRCSTPGAEAVENAVKIARIATGRDAVVVFEHGYHGRTNLTMAMTAKDKPYKHGFGPFAGEVYRMPLAYPFRWPTGPENCGPEALAAVISKIDKELGADQVAAIVIEPIQGEGGFIVPGEGFLAGLADVRQGQRDRVRRRRGADRLRAYRCHVRLRARGRRARPHRHRQGDGRRACPWPP